MIRAILKRCMRCIWKAVTSLVKTDCSIRKTVYGGAMQILTRHILNLTEKIPIGVVVMVG